MPDIVSRTFVVAIAASIASWLAPVPATGGASVHEKVLYNFCSQQNCTDGSQPGSALLADGSGNLYGTTYSGGNRNFGTVFKLAPDGTEQVLHSFCADDQCADGAYPRYGALIADGAGNLYGMANEDGAHDNGTVFRVSSSGAETTLYTFCAKTNCWDGALPFAGLAMDSSGNLYGTTSRGGGHAEFPPADGVIFRISSRGKESVLRSFCSKRDCLDGGGPNAGPIMDNLGNLYGTALYGGKGQHGVVFKLSPDGAYTVLHAFCTKPNCTDGADPFAGVVMDNAGNLYGATNSGGKGGGGVVFKLTPSGIETQLHAFCSNAMCKDGHAPIGVIVDGAGNVYGTTIEGGKHDAGAIFKITPDGTETVLYSFCSRAACADGETPFGSLIADDTGNLYGTTAGGGSNNAGVVFKISLAQ